MYKRKRIKVFCYETKQEFVSMAEATRWCGVKCTVHISICVNKPNKTVGGYHWCTDLSIFDGLLLSSGSDLQKKIIYNYETKEKFNSMAEAARKYNLSGCRAIKFSLDNPLSTAAGFHWCTNLETFKPEKLDNSSSGEKEVRNFIESFGYKTIKTRQVIKPYEIDIFIPELNLGIEYNGDYWHSEKVLSKKHNNYKTYHEDKTKLAESRGIKLIHIWESEWNNTKEAVKEKIKNLLWSYDVDLINSENKKVIAEYRSLISGGE